MAEEELLKADSKGDNQEAELLILDEFAVLCRDLYAFYPMLIRYVDNNRYNIGKERLVFISRSLGNILICEVCSVFFHVFSELYTPIFLINQIIILSCPVRSNTA